MDRDTHQTWLNLCDKCDKVGYESLPRAEQTWLNIRALIDSTENGGLISYFYNSYADTLDDCLEDLQTLGAEAVREQVLRVCSLFPNGTPGDFVERNAAINRWDQVMPDVDEKLGEIDDILMPLMADLEERLNAFLRDADLTR